MRTSDPLLTLGLPSQHCWAEASLLLPSGKGHSLHCAEEEELTAHGSVSQKYYKLRNESDKKLQPGGQSISAPSTPTKRKREGDIKTPTKRAKNPVKVESFDGEPFSDVSSSPFSQEPKLEEEHKLDLSSYQPPGDDFYDPGDFFKPVYGLNPESSMTSSMTSSGASSSFATGSFMGWAGEGLAQMEPKLGQEL